MVDFIQLSKMFYKNKGIQTLKLNEPPYGHWLSFHR